MIEQKKILIDEKYQNQRYVYHFFKRTLDIIASAAGLIVLSPVFLIISIAIKAEDPRGPIFYSQTRLGKGQRPFKMYKFRSMVVDADKKLERLLKQNEVEGAMFKMKEDPRITKIGKFIRRHSLDELPQLLNVLIGDMTLVGPRPPLEREVVDYSSYHLQRLIVKPGCTGLWQVSGRNNLDFDGMVELDLKYIENSNIVYDVSILLRTVMIIFKPNGAY